jgi:D-glycero-D-manno-heptose 1,7-bisphosphate phosphatase
LRLRSKDILRAIAQGRTGVEPLRCTKTEAEWEPDSNLLRIHFREINDAAKRPAIFIDRDGVINCRRPGDYVLDWAQFAFMPGIREALQQLASFGLPMIIISNQAAVGKGLLDPAGLEEITARMNEELLADGTSLAAAYYCTHRIEDHCACRKPKPALLFSAAADLNIDLFRSIFIGDSDTDVQAARAAGCASVLFGSDFTLQPTAPSDLHTAHGAMDLYAVVAKHLQAAEHA